MFRILDKKIIYLVVFLAGCVPVIMLFDLIQRDFEVEGFANLFSLLVSPLLNLFSVLILAHSFREQVMANRSLQRQIDLGEEKVYFEYFIKCHSEWRAVSYNLRINVADLQIKDFSLFNDLSELVSKVKSADTSSTPFYSDALKGYCSNQISSIARVANSLETANDNIKSLARRQSLLTELDFFNSQILERNQIGELISDSNNIRELKNVELSELNELLGLLEFFWRIAEIDS